MVLLIVYQVYGSAAQGSVAYVLLTGSFWFLVISWLFGPFIFNPSGFEWQKIVDDWDDWKKWISSHGGIGVPANKSWESWWDEEQEHLQHTGFMGRIWEIVLSLRFFIYQYGIVYHLHVANGDTGIMVSMRSLSSDLKKRGKRKLKEKREALLGFEPCFLHLEQLSECRAS